MASIPNMRAQQASPVPGAPATPDAVIADIFARIIAGGPAIVPVDAADPEVVAISPEGDAEGETGDGEAPAGAQAATPDAMLPLLQAQSGFPAIVAAPPPVAPAPGTASENAPAAIASTKTAAAVPQNSKPTAANDESAPDEATFVAKAVIESKIGKPVVREGGKGKPGAAGTVTAEAAPRFAPPAAPVVLERNERPAPVEAPVSAPVAASAAPVQNTTSALPPFFTPVQTIVAAEVAAPVPAAQSAPAEIAVERELDLARDGAWLDRLARDIARAGSEDGTMRFRLHPQTLGHMRVELSQSDLGATVRLTVETEAARNILVDAQPRLVAEARAQGVRLAGTEVDLAGSGPQTSGDPRRQADAEAQPMIRTARARDEAASAAESATRSDRYA